MRYQLLPPFVAALMLQPASAQQSAQTLDRVVVTATRSERAQLDVPASIDVLERDEIRDGNLRVNLSESLTRVPG
ncbi:MAG: TonB-dependent siderophore receptor, partial [Burkholderiaceae bacterium]